MTKLRFPSGDIGYEIRHYMGMEDPKGHLLERPEIVQRMYNDGKCQPGKIAEYTKEEIAQLSGEVANALDIKADQVDPTGHPKYDWTPLKHYHLQQFYKKLNSLPILISLIAVLVFSSCNTVKDCRGVKHVKLSNGVRL
jgi:hypothetical protein